MNDSPKALWAHKYNRLIIQAKYPVKEEECVICYETLFNKPVMYLPCKHFFHHSCFKKVIESNAYTCPFCRFDFKIALVKTGFRGPSGYNYIESYLNAVDADAAPHIIDTLYWDMVSYYSHLLTLSAAEAAVLAAAEVAVAAEVAPADYFISPEFILYYLI